ncbi:fimbrial protein, partial [Klebsiella quasipneumoniae]|uniref:fimbrial protein n=1 Tax=Klebsiella quasipneumoniae TaxID=1463165 RepID=UPI001037D46F
PNKTIASRGQASAETCSDPSNGQRAKPVVILPTVGARKFALGGDVAGQVTFDIGLTGCTGNTDRATKISTVFVGNQVTSNGNLGNTGDATNVEVQLLDTANKVINLTNGFKGEGDLQLKPGETEASATYTAQYYATGAASAGTVEATLQYAVSYL